MGAERGLQGVLEVVTVCTGMFQQNCHLLYEPKSRECFVIDPGEGVDEIEEAIRAEGLRPLAITNTHAHLDHVAGVAELKKRTGLPFHLHPDEFFLLDILAEHSAYFGMRAPERPTVDFELAQGQVLELGGVKIDCLLVPGHTPGSICFVGGGQAVVGDVLFAGSIGRTDLPGGTPGLLEKNIKKTLYPLPDATRVHSGHGPETTIGREARSNPFVRR